MISREEWVALYDLPEVQESIEYVEWRQAHDGVRFFAQMFAAFCRNAKSRMEQLRKYAEKQKDPNATFRPYAPLKASDTTRTQLKRRAKAEGVSSDQMTRVCGHEGLDGRRCWIAPHNSAVPHQF